MKDRVYICHTYYHVYISFLKEMKLREELIKNNRDCGICDLIISTMSTKFEEFKDRVESTGFFDSVFEYDEQRENGHPQLEKLKVDRENIVLNMLARIKFTRGLAKLQDEYLPVNLKDYKDIYVFCDIDPIGYYLNVNHIYYHAVEDGLNCLKNYDAARYDNRGHFALKAFLSKKLNIIFVQNGYGRYCLDMEVNDISAIKYACPYYIEEPRKALTDRLTKADKEILLKAFVRDKDTLEEKINEAIENKDGILILTDPLCSLDIRKKIFEDIINTYAKEGTIFIKPHPRDMLDYRTNFREFSQFDAAVPMEILSFFDGIRFKKVIGVLTEMTSFTIADEVIRLGPDFMDKYEDAFIHRQNENIY